MNNFSKSSNGEKTACAPILLYEPNGSQTQIASARTIFKYPIVGSIVFYQPKDQFWEDTVIEIEYLIHADGLRVNNTDDHRWAIHERPPNKDFYDWQNRCFSAGKVTNNLGEKLGNLRIAGSFVSRVISRVMFVDPSVALDGPHSVMGKSVVIYYDQDTNNRGDRFACTK